MGSQHGCRACARLGGRRRLFVTRRSRLAARAPSRDLVHGTRRRRHRADRDRARRSPAAGRHDHRRRQQPLQRRCETGRRAGDTRHPLSRRGDERRHLGRRPRLLPDDRRPAARGRAAHADLPHARARSGIAAALARSRCDEDDRARRLPLLRRVGCRSLREDDSQRHRVRADAVLRRRVRHPRERQLRLAPPGDRRVVAARQRRQLVAAGPRRAGAGERSGARGVRRKGCGLG